MSTNKVRWTQQHLDELEKNFPEITVPVVDELLHQSGARKVVQYVRGRLKAQETRLND